MHLLWGYGFYQVFRKRFVYIYILFSGVKHVVRTCAGHMNIQFPLSIVCMSESRPGDGHLCLCQEDKCNTAPTIDNAQVGSLILVLLLMIILLQNLILDYGFSTTNFPKRKYKSQSTDNCWRVVAHQETNILLPQLYRLHGKHFRLVLSRLCDFLNVSNLTTTLSATQSSVCCFNGTKSGFFLIPRSITTSHRGIHVFCVRDKNASISPSYYSSQISYYYVLLSDDWFDSYHVFNDTLGLFAQLCLSSASLVTSSLNQHIAFSWGFIFPVIV